jgi:hypothetical protein
LLLHFVSHSFSLEFLRSRLVMARSRVVFSIQFLVRVPIYLFGFSGSARC